MHSVKLRDHLLQILPVLPPQVILLHTASSTPCPFLRFRSVHDRVFSEHFVLDRCNHAASPDHTSRGYPQRVVDASTDTNCVPIPYAWRLDPYWSRTATSTVLEDDRSGELLLTAANLEQVVVPNAHHLLAPEWVLRNQNAGPCVHELDRYRLIITVPSSMMQLFPITTGPVCPKMTTFG